MRKLMFFLFFSAVYISVAAQNVNTKLNAEITGILQSYCAAVAEKNPDKVISFYDDSPDFLIFLNGKSADYQNYTADIRAHLPKYQKVEIKFDNLLIRQINKEVVVVSSVFKEVMTDPDGKTYSFDVPTSWVLIKKSGTWKLIHATAFFQLDAK